MTLQGQEPLKIDPSLEAKIIELGFEEFEGQEIIPDHAYLPAECFFENIDDALDVAGESLEDKIEADQMQLQEGNFEQIPQAIMTPIGQLHPETKRFLLQNLIKFLENPYEVCPHALKRHEDDATAACQLLIDELRSGSTFGCVTLCKSDPVMYKDFAVDGFLRLALIGEETEYANFPVPDSYIASLDVQTNNTLEGLGDLTKIDLADLLMVLAYLQVPGDKLFLKGAAEDAVINGLDINIPMLARTIGLKCDEQGIKKAKLFTAYNKAHKYISMTKLLIQASGTRDRFDFDWTTHNNALVALENIMGGTLHISPQASRLSLVERPFVIFSTVQEEIARRDRKNRGLGMDMSASIAEYPLFTSKMVTAYMQHTYFVKDVI